MTKTKSEKCIEAVHTMGLLIPFFPKEEETQRIIAEHIERFVNTEAELFWIMTTACGSIRDWEKSGGMPELRGLFCSQFKPADGIFEYCTTVGYRPADLEERFRAKEREDNDRRFEQYRREALAAPEEDRKPFPLPKPKLLQ